MKSVVTLLFASCLWYFAGAQAFTSVKDEVSLLKRIAEASQKINSIQCDFVQEKNLSMLSQKAVSKGRFYFKKENKVRLEYLHPLKNLIVMNNGKMLMKDDKKTTQADMHRNRAFQQLNNIIVGSINGSLFSNSNFSYQLFENGTQVKIELKPLQKTMKNFLSTIVIVLEKKDFSAARIEMNEASGDNTILTFSNKEINEALADSLFAVN